MPGILVQSGRLTLALAALWGVLAGPAYLVAGASAVVGLTAAVLVCLLPGLVVLALQAGPLGSQQPFAGLILGMGLRMAVVLTSVLLVRQSLPDLPMTVYVAWLVPAYLAALTVETRIALAQVQRRVELPLESTRLYSTGTH
ncbi:MAG: hypothetical protein AB7U20_03740 [Planctomycetaceae bacterium]